MAQVPGRGVPGRGLKLDQPPGSLCAPPHTGHNCDPGGREPTFHRCPKCDIFVSLNSLNGRHLTMESCRQGEERKWIRLAEEEARAGEEAEIKAYGIPLDPFLSFKYLRRFISAEENYWPSVVRNIWRERNNWARMTRVMSR